MMYLESFEKENQAWIGLLTSCAHLHSGPVLYADRSGRILGCNEQLLHLMDSEKPEEIGPMDGWLKLQGIEHSYLLSNPGSYRGKIQFKESVYDMDIRAESMPLGEESITALVFQDNSVIERAKAAERYFEQFKKIFLTNISHEFRTPMNAIIGFTDLLKSTPLSSWQKEYVQMTSLSAMSMMRNIENLLELMQVESGAIRANFHHFNPMEVFESFSMQFDDLASDKEIQLLFLIDPHLPKTMTGDQDKILSILRNLIQNAIKFTNEKGRVLVEMLIIQDEGKSVEIEYAVSDTGMGIESEKIKMLLRPFASGLENQRKGKGGLGIGLSLSHKYADMMGSHLMLASEPGKGSRFSFRVHHKVNEHGNYEFQKGTRGAVYTEGEAATTQGELLRKYLELYNVKTIITNTLVNPELLECDVLFMDTPNVSRSQIESLRSTYPKLQIVPILKLNYGEKADKLMEAVESIVTLPVLPSSLHKTLAVIWNKMPKEYIIQSHEAQSVPRQEDVKILIAEDNLINLRLLETILVQENFRVVAVDNGQKAVDAYLHEPFDLVLMDIDMPVMDGLTANRLIKEIDKRDRRKFTPVIALTAHALVGDRERIVAAGLDAHLAKPIDKHFLIQTIDRYLKIAQQRHQKKSI